MTDLIRNLTALMTDLEQEQAAARARYHSIADRVTDLAETLAELQARERYRLAADAMGIDT